MRGARSLAALLALAVAGACGGQKASKPAESGEPSSSSLAGPTGDAAASEDPGPSDAETALAAGLLGNALKQAKEPGPWDEPRSSPGASGKKPHHVVIEVTGSIDELSTFSIWSGATGAELRKLTDRLHALAGDAKVQSILLRVGDLEMSFAAAEELRAALVSAKADTRPLHCHAESLTGLTYVVLTACDTVTVAPSSLILLAGPAAMPLHFKGLLDRLGLEFDAIHIGAYKGAAEPFTRAEPSREMRETLDAILDGAYERMLGAIVEGRRVDRGRAAAWVDRALFTDEEARREGLVDGVEIYEAWRDRLVAGGAWRKVTIEDDKLDDIESLMTMLGAAPRKRITKPHVALLYAVGEVVDGKGSALEAREQISSRRLAAALRAAAANDHVKAIVIRVDSPGGSALASELIWHAVAEAKARKPVVVSMGGLAASGGYYISCGATKIWAQPDTLTGSIGVVAGKLVIGPALKDLGVNAIEMGRGKRANLFSPVRRFSPDERAAVEGAMRAVYDRFKARVAEGRGRRPEEVETVAQGRVWVGARAKELGLVDALGGLDDAIADARQLGGLGADAPIDVYPPEPTLLEMLEDLGSSGVRAPGGMLGDLVADVATAFGPEAAAITLRTFRALLAFRDEPVRVVTFFPVVLR